MFDTRTSDIYTSCGFDVVCGGHWGAIFINALDTKKGMTLQELVRSLKRKKAIHSIIQFGSSIKTKKYRDIDLCLMTTRDISLQEKLAILANIPDLYDISFYDDLAIPLKKEVLGGKILFTKDYFHVLQELRRVGDEFIRFNPFLEEYHKKRMAEI